MSFSFFYRSDMATPEMMPSKRARHDCMLDCHESDPNAKLTTLQDYSSWQTVLHAADIQNHASVQNLAFGLAEGEIPCLHYHRKCCSLFTKKRDLNTILSRQQTASQTLPIPESIVLNKGSSTDGYRVYDPVCIFCSGVKYLKGSGNKAPLVQCREMHADITIRAAAISEHDSRLLAILSRELVAAEGHYH